MSSTDEGMRGEDAPAAETSNYGIASMDQLDDDEPAKPAAAAAAAASPEGQSNGSGVEGQPQPEVESFAFAVGVIEPPPDLKVIIDRTADFVRRVGPNFEGEIMQRNKGKKQFQFLENPASPYHAYYKQRVKYGAEGPPPELVAAAVGSAAHLAEQARQRTLEAKKAAEAAAVEAAQPAKPLTLVERMQAYIDSMHIADKTRVQEAKQARKEAAAGQTNGSAQPAAAAANSAPSTSGSIHPSRAAPAGSSAAASSPSPSGAAAPSFSFRIKHPDHYSPVDLDIIKLTALYVARCGQEFLHGLQRREQRNAYFDFIKPQHPLFVFFQQLVEAYNRVIVPKKDVRDELDKIIRRTPRDQYWQQLLVDAALKKASDAAAAALKASEDADRNVLASIDWKDFVVVQHITFRDDEDAYLPAPRDTVEEMAAMLSAQTLEDVPGGAGETDMDMDQDMDTQQEGQPAPAAPAAAAAAQARAAPSPPAATTGESEEVAQLIRSTVVIPDEEQLEIRTNVDPSSSSSKPRSAVFQKCIVCGDEIAIDDLAEHMRIELLDPRWKFQKQALLDKQRESALAADSIVSANLARMARRVIGSDDNKEQEQRNKLKALQQEAADAALLFGPHSQQAREAAARAGQVVLPPPPPKPQAAPVAPAAPIGPAYRPAQPVQPPPMAPAAAAASAHIPVHRPMPPTNVPGAAAAGAPGVPAGPPRPVMPLGAPVPGGPLAPGMLPVRPGGLPSVLPPFNPAAPYGVPPPFPGAPGVPRPVVPLAAVAAAPPQPQHAAPAVAAEDQQAAKKQRVDSGAAVPTPAAPLVPVPAAAPAAAAAPAGKGGLVPEAAFLAANPATISVRVSVPSDPASAFNFAGQTLSLTAQLTDTVQSLKEQISQQLNKLAPNKMKLQFAAGTGSGVTAGGTHLNKDDCTLAFYNVPDNATLSVGIKERGGKKK